MIQYSNHWIIYFILLVIILYFYYDKNSIVQFAPEKTRIVITRIVIKQEPSIFLSMSKHYDLKCQQLFEKDANYTKELKKNRIVYNDSPEIQTDCNSIKGRSYFSRWPNSKEEAEFPIAYAKLVFKDYLFLERELSVEYAPQNWYCFSIDSKASEIFKNRMKDLSNCLPNVILNKQEYDMNEYGTNHNYAYVDCIRELSQYEWKYIILMQNHDILLRTNSELVKIFTWFNGTNDISADNMDPYMYRIDANVKWTFENIKLFRDSKRNFNSSSGAPIKVKFAKSLVESAVSRAMVDFMINNLTLTTFMQKLQMNNKCCSSEETMLATLNAADEINAPGGFTHWCLDKHKIEVSSISRRTLWNYAGPAPGCESKQMRHGICIYGIEDLYIFESLHHIMLNKMLPEFDFGAIICWHERLFNRTYFNTTSKYRLNSEYYLSLPHVRYNNEKIKNGKVDLDKFDCRVNSKIKPMLSV